MSGESRCPKVLFAAITPVDTSVDLVSTAAYTFDWMAELASTGLVHDFCAAAAVVPGFGTCGFVGLCPGRAGVGKIQARGIRGDEDEDEGVGEEGVRWSGFGFDGDLQLA